MTQRSIRFYILSETRTEQTDARLSGYVIDGGASRDEYDAVVDEMIDSGEIRPTIIDGGERFGMLAGLVRC